MDRVSRELAAGEVLCALDRNELLSLARFCCVTAVSKGGVVFLPGDKAAVYLVARGRVAVITQLEVGVEVELFTRRRHELFGEASLFCGKQINEARAVEPALMVVIPAEAFRDAVHQNPVARAAFETLLGQRMALAEARVAEIATHSVRSRLLHVLRRMALEAGVRESRGWAIADHITQEELASVVGASRVSVSHALGALRATGQILVTERRIIVCGVGQRERGGGHGACL